MKQDMPSCGGCRTCEMVCSFHHTGEYNPSLSSIKIREKDNGTGYLVLLLEEKSTEGFACDQCQGLDKPLCLKVCREENDLANILRTLTASATPIDEENKSGGSFP
jgi:Fe-S-cluster-containing hydrogenase component 2